MKREYKDQISITISGEVGNPKYTGDKNFLLPPSLLTSSNNLDKQVNAGMFGHEIVHLTQEGFWDKLLFGKFSSSLRREIEAYYLEDKIFSNMGLERSDHGTVAYVEDWAQLRGASPHTILTSPLTTAQGQYNNMALSIMGTRTGDECRWLNRCPQLME